MPTFRSSISGALALVAVVGVGVAFLTQQVAYRSKIAALEQMVYAARYEKDFREFVAATFGELGSVVMEDPQDVWIYPVSADDARLYDPTPREILLLISNREGERLAPGVAQELYKEFTIANVDYQLSCDDPAPTAMLKVERNGDTVILVSGEENHQVFVKVVVFDMERRLTNERRAWARVRSATLNKLTQRPMPE